MREFDATVAICTYNGEARIKSVLHSLTLQHTPRYTWEVLIVDNASTDDTAKACEILVDTLPVRGRVVKEERLGISNARKRASIDSKGRVICFLDDDNLAGPNYIYNALKFLDEHPKCGLVGGKIEPIWETAPTGLVLSVCRFALAICDHGDKSFRYEGRFSGPVSAGASIRRDLLCAIYEESNLEKTIPSRTGSNLSSGEDAAFCVLAKQLGFECWYEPLIQSKHRIPKWRMKKNYLLKLFEGIGQGQASVRKLWDWKARNPITASLIAGKDIARYFARCTQYPWNVKAGTHPLAKDLHDLNLRLLRGRILGTLSIK